MLAVHRRDRDGQRARVAALRRRGLIFTVAVFVALAAIDGIVAGPAAAAADSLTVTWTFDSVDVALVLHRDVDAWSR